MIDDSSGMTAETIPFRILLRQHLHNLKEIKKAIQTYEVNKNLVRALVNLHLEDNDRGNGRTGFQNR